MSSANYPKEARLHSPSEFAAVFTARRVFRGALFSLHQSKTKPTLETNPACARLGLVIAKRYASRAVTRNTIKRVVREAFRQRRNRLPARDYIIRLHAPAPLCSLTQLRKDVRQEIDALFDRIR